MSREVRDYLQELSTGGVVEGDSSGFSLRSDKALEKLKKFSLQNPENYFLLIIASLHSLGATRLQLEADADDLVVWGDCGVEFEALNALWEKVVGGDSSRSKDGLRLLALAMLTSVQFGTVRWTVSGQDQDGSFVFQQEIRGGDLAEPVSGRCEGSISGLEVRVKRRSLREVTGRFFSKLKERLFSQVGSEQETISRRVFLGAFQQFTINGKALPVKETGEEVLVQYCRGTMNRFAKATYQVHEEGELAVAVLLEKPDQRHPDTLPGERKMIQWLWHGLTMGRTDLKLPYQFCRVFVMADSSNPDLSFSALPDTWERQKMERTARAVVRLALERLVEQFGAVQEGVLECRDPEGERVVLQVLAERIDLRRSRHRLASFNRSLINCPLFPASGPDGTTVRVSFSHLWVLLERGVPLAMFRPGEEAVSVPAWPDRPWIIYGEEWHRQALMEVCGPDYFHDAKEVAEKVTALLKNSDSVTSTADGSTEYEAFTANLPYSFPCEVNGETLRWSVTDERDGSGDLLPGRLMVFRKGRRYFEDSTLGLPEGVVVFGECSLEADFRGRLKDRKLGDRIRESLLSNLIDRVGEQSDSLLQIYPRLLNEMLNWEESWSADHGAFNREWLVGWRPGNEKPELVSPATYLSQTALYYSLTPGSSSPPGWDLFTLFLPGESFVERFAQRVGRSLHAVRGIELLEQRAPSRLDETHFITYSWHRNLMGTLDAGLASAQVGFPFKEAEQDNPDRLTLEANLRGHGLQKKYLGHFVTPLVVCFDWKEGHPDSRGLHLISEEQNEKAKDCLPRLVRWACGRLLSEQSVKELLKLHPQTLQTAWLEVWSDPDQKDTKLFPTTGGALVSRAELEEQGATIYCTAPLPENDVLWLPPLVAEELDLLGNKIYWSAFQHDPEPEPQPTASPAAPSPKVSPPKTTPIRQVVRKEPAAAVSEPVVTLPPPGGLVGEFELVAALGEVPGGDEFRRFLHTVDFRKGHRPLVSLEKQRPVVGLSESELENNLQLSWMILSALYSVFNRLEEEIKDECERMFHALLLKRAVDG